MPVVSPQWQGETFERKGIRKVKQIGRNPANQKEVLTFS